MAYYKGKPAPNRGIPHKEKTKKKISQSCKKAGVGKWNTGITRTEENRERISDGLKEYYKTHNSWNYGLRWPIGLDKNERSKETSLLTFEEEVIV